MDNKNIYYVGIDFGTSNLKVSAWQNGKIRYVNLSDEQKKWVPNVISRKQKKDGSFEYLFGNNAINDSTINATELIYNVKSYLENEDNTIIFKDGFTTTAEQLSTEIFSMISNRIVLQRGNNEITGAVITVPVCYSEMQKHRIKKSAEKANIKVSAMITEPIASLFTFDEYKDFLKDKKTRIVFILDFGGGTIDASLIKLKYVSISNTSDITVLASSGINYGGSDITQTMLDKFVIPKFKQEYLEEVKLGYKYDFIRQMDNLKASLFNEFVCDDDEQQFFYMTKKGVEIKVDISVADFEQVFVESDLKNRLISMFDKIIYDDADIDIEDITNIHFIGGGSAIPYFRNILNEYFSENQDIELEDFEEDEAYMYVSKGASEYAHIIDNPNENIVFHDRCAFSIVGSNGIRYIQKNFMYGLKTLKRPVNVEISPSGTKYMRFFQNIDNVSSKIYMGYFPFSDTLWENSAKLFDMMLCHDGNIIGEFYDENNTSVGTCKMIMEDKEYAVEY